MNNCSDITVIIPAYNSSHTIERAIDSIISQTVVPEQVIVIDDASTDNTALILNKIKNRELPFSFLVICNNNNLGPGTSRNSGWDIATTKWIAFLDADDAWHPRKLELQLNVVAEHPTLDLVCTQTYLMKSVTELPSIEDERRITRISLSRMFFRNVIATRSVLIRQEVSHRFRSGLSEDFGLWLDCLNSGLIFAKLEAPLAFHYRQEFSPGGLSSQLVTHEYFELRNLWRYASSRPILIFAASNFSIVKFLRRVFLVILRKAIN